MMLKDGLIHDENYDENDKRPLTIVMNKKVIGLLKDELGGKIIKEFCEQKHIHTQWVMIVKLKKLKEQKYL